jgi:PhzF family phenazine biosynthesis protein
MKNSIYQVDAFTNKLYTGNPAAICPLNSWPQDEVMQQIAAENNLAETAFYVKEGEYYHIRWFTPTTEVDLCGHATLAAAHVLYNHQGFNAPEAVFNSRSGLLKVTQSNHLYTMDFPVDTVKEVVMTPLMINAFSHQPKAAFKGKTDYLFLFEDEASIAGMEVDLSAIRQLDARGAIITAAGSTCDFVSRFFGPQAGIDEDPVTGSAHTTLTPFWAKRLGKRKMQAKQLSKRGGELTCVLSGDRIELSGEAVTYLSGEIELNDGN